MTLSDVTQEALAEATGRRRRVDPVVEPTGGPAGNALLTAWTGLILLLLFLVELATLLNLSRLISWHIVVGVLLVPPALLKTASTGWRIVQYYTRQAQYEEAGPPPLLLRLLGPLVVLFTLALLGSGLLLIAVGPQAGRGGFVTVVGHPVSLVTVHAGLAVCWGAVTGLHVLARLASLLVILGPPRIGRTSGHSVPRVPGRPLRALTVGVVVLAAVLAANAVRPLDGGWTRDGHHDRARTGGEPSRRPQSLTAPDGQIEEAGDQAHRVGCPRAVQHPAPCAWRPAGQCLRQPARQHAHCAADGPQAPHQTPGL